MTFINQQRKLIYIRLSNVITEVTLYVLLIYIRLSNVITEVTLYVLLSDLLNNCLNVGTITIVSDVLKYYITSLFFTLQLRK